MLFALIYSGTVAKFPKAIFVSSSGILVVALCLLFLVRIPGSEGASSSSIKKRKARKEISVERGRSLISKDLRPIILVNGEGSGTSTGQTVTSYEA